MKGRFKMASSTTSKNRTVCGLRTAALLSLALTISGCGGSTLALGRSASDDIARVLGRSVKQIELPPSAVDDIASRAGAGNGQVAGVASSLTSRESWKRAVSSVGKVRAEHGEEISEIATSVACDALREARDLTNEDLAIAAVRRVAPHLAPPDLQAAARAALGLHSEMTEAAQRDREADISVLLFCFGVMDTP